MDLVVCVLVKGREYFWGCWSRKAGLDAVGAQGKDVLLSTNLRLQRLQKLTNASMCT